MAYEIEKRYYVNGEIPKSDIFKTIKIEQSYASTNPDVRIRKTEEENQTEYTHCVKYNVSKDIREEIEQSISQEQYENIKKFIDKEPIVKIRYYIQLENNIAEVDYFIQENKYIVEVEFESEEQMNNFKKPNWFGDEIEQGKMYSMMMFNKINSKDCFERLKSYIGGR